MIGIIPIEKRKANLKKLNLDSLEWPLEQRAPSGKITDLASSDHIVVYASSKLFYRALPRISCNISIIMYEPLIIQGRYYFLLRLYFWRRFKYIFARYNFLKKSVPNVHILPTMFSYINIDELGKIEKIHTVSLIASERRNQKGHKIRHRIVKRIRSEGLDEKIDIDIIGRCYKPFKEKYEGLSPYKYSVVIENAKEPDYISEKILDCLICETIPIYWGAPNVGDYFNMEGIIECQTVDEIVMAIKMIPILDTDRMINAIKENKERAIKYASVHKNIAQIIDQLE